MKKNYWVTSTFSNGQREMKKIKALNSGDAICHVMISYGMTQLENLLSVVAEKEKVLTSVPS